MPDSAERPVIRLSYDRPPGSAGAYLQALIDKRPSRLQAGATSPRIEGRVGTAAWSGSLLRRYRGVCGFAEIPGLPLPFPHVIGSGLHLRMLLHREFPVRLPGLVHVWHRIRQWRPLASTERFSMFSRIEGHTETDAGAEFCLETRLLAGDEVVWEEQTGFVARAARRRGPANRSAVSQPEIVGPTREVARFDASSDVGRRYALASGDYNPIHLAAASARPFGFPRAIAHGMWTLARCVAELQSRQSVGGAEISVRFRRPVFLPSSLVLEATDPVDGDTAFRVRESDSGVVCLAGRFGAPHGVAADATG